MKTTIYKLIFAAIVLVAMTGVFYVLSHCYNYVQHPAYIYKFERNMGEYRIIFKDKYDTRTSITVDSADFVWYSAPENRKKWFKIRHYDDGRTLILNNGMME